MGCLVALIALLSPRLALVLIWLFSDRVSLAFDGNPLVPLVGFLFLPWTTVAWVLVYAPIRGVSELGWLVVIFAFLADLSSLGAGEWGRRRRYAME